MSNISQRLARAEGEARAVALALIEADLNQASDRLNSLLTPAERANLCELLTRSVADRATEPTDAERAVLDKIHGDTQARAALADFYAGILTIEPDDPAPWIAELLEKDS